MQTNHSSPQLGHRVSARNSEGRFLNFLGNRVRELRSRRAMTRKSLARDADVSERHLAQLEGGEGNVSIVLLRRIANALEVSLPELFSQREADMCQEQFLLGRLLEAIPAHRIQETMTRLMREFSEEEFARRERIALIGIRGAGKSTLGTRLAAEMQVPFLEIDREIEKEAGMPLGEIFSLYGQTGYREFERRVLERLLRQKRRAILSIGGGVVSEKETYDYLLSRCYTVWIKANPDEYMARVIAQGDFRVMGGNNQAMEELRRILESREPLYRKADACLDTSGRSVEESFAKLRTLLAAGQA